MLGRGESERAKPPRLFIAGLAIGLDHAEPRVFDSELGWAWLSDLPFFCKFEFRDALFVSRGGFPQRLGLLVWENRV